MTGAGDSDQGAVREGNVHSFPLASVDSVGSKRGARNAVRRPSRTAVRARAVAELEGGNNEVALGDAVYVCSDLLDDANEFVANGAPRMRRLTAVVPEV